MASCTRVKEYFIATQHHWDTALHHRTTELEHLVDMVKLGGSELAMGHDQSNTRPSRIWTKLGSYIVSVETLTHS